VNSKKRVVILVVGPKRAIEEYFSTYPKKDLFVYQGKNKYGGYHGHKNLFFRDFNGEMDYATLLSILTNDKVTVDVGKIKLDVVTDKIIISSSKLPWDWFENNAATGKGYNLKELSKCIDKLINWEPSTESFVVVDDLQQKLFDLDASRTKKS
jgi:hypothetical protein